MKSKVGFHLFLGFLTFLTLTFKGNLIGLFFPLENKMQIFSNLFFTELPYSISLLFILFCHEMGHYLPARFYKIEATLPYFIPIPFDPVGTMGAVISIKEPIRTKLQLFDIGTGGPLMSLILSVIAWCIGLKFSELVEINKFGDASNLLEFGDSLFTYYSGQWILGPYDPKNITILIHPLAKAGWVGLLITAINLLPFGQLDGGHIIYSLFKENYRKWIYYLFIVFLFLGLVNFSWVLWGFIIYYLIKVEHPYVPDGEELNFTRKAIGIFLLLSLIFIFVPNPIHTNNSLLIEDIFRFFQK